jgi:hypothetical protein
MGIIKINKSDYISMMISGFFHLHPVLFLDVFLPFEQDWIFPSGPTIRQSRTEQHKSFSTSKTNLPYLALRGISFVHGNPSDDYKFRGTPTSTKAPGLHALPRIKTITPH